MSPARDAAAVAAAFAIPGDLATPTGGYEYDRRLIGAGPEAGLRLVPLALPGGFPSPSPAEVDEALAALTAAPGPILIDGLAFGALPADRLGPELRARLCALCHHPLGLETGLSPDESTRLLATEAAALSAAAHVVVTSAETARTLIARLGVTQDSITVAPPGLERSPPAERRGAPPVILGVGTVSLRKGWDVLAEALALLPPDLRWRCVIAGDDARDPAAAADLRARLKRHELEDRVSLSGPLDRAGVDAAYLDADLFCLPSRYEGYGMVIAEAMMRGLPVISTTAGAIPEASGGAARLVPPDDPAALAEALAALLTDPEARDRLSAGSRDRALSLPEWTDTARIVADVLRRLA